MEPSGAIPSSLAISVDSCNTLPGVECDRELDLMYLDVEDSFKVSNLEDKPNHMICGQSWLILAWLSGRSMGTHLPSKTCCYLAISAEG